MKFVGLKLNDEHPNVRQFGANHALRVLFAINLLNYADRYVPAAVKTLFAEELHLSDFQTTLPNTGMIIVFMIFAVIFGLINDHQLVDRRFILCFGIILWSAATALAGLSKNLIQLVALRSLVGVGEAAYGTIAPPILSDFFPERERNVVYGVYYLAIPVGAALGYGIGAVLGGAFGWQAAFYGVGLPGLLISFLILGINDPTSGINDFSGTRFVEPPSVGLEVGGLGRSWYSRMIVAVELFYVDSKEILTNKPFVVVLAGQIASNFALGGLADWLGTYLIRYQGADVSSAGLLVGAATVIGGISGNILGAKIADHFKSTIKSSFFLIPAIFTIPASISMLLAINIPNNLSISAACIFIGNLFTWTYTAPISAISITVIPTRLRSQSCGLLIFFQHILGDIISPPIIGAIADQTGSLQNGLQITWLALLLSGIIYFYGYYSLEPLDVYEKLAAGSGHDTGIGGIGTSRGIGGIGTSRGNGNKVGDSGLSTDADIELHTPPTSTSIHTDIQPIESIIAPWAILENHTPIPTTTGTSGGGSTYMSIDDVAAIPIILPSYSSLLCSNIEPLMMVDGVIVRVDARERG